MFHLSSLMVAICTFNAVPQGELLCFTSRSCGPCQLMSPTISQLQRAGYPIRKIDVKQYPATTRRHRIGPIPAFVLIVNNKEVRRIEGQTSRESLLGLLNQIPYKKSAAELASQNDRSTTRAQSSELLPESEWNPVIRSDANIQTAANTEPISAPLVTKTAVSTTTSNTVSHKDPLLSTVRIRVKDNLGINYGSGTVILSSQGKSVVLTCGHLFRDMKPESVIHIDLYDGKEFHSYLGTVLKFDLDADVGLVELQLPVTLPVVPVAGARTQIQTQNMVSSLGCSGGNKPSRTQHQVTGINVHEGPDNIKCTGVPVQGRSGGGLLNATGELIGVCIAADLHKKQGVYCGLAPLHHILDQVNLSHLYRSQSQSTLASNNSSNSPLSKSGPSASVVPANSNTTRTANVSELPQSQWAVIQKALQESGDAEVICIVRSSNPKLKGNRVIVINQASQKFISYLNNELEVPANSQVQSAFSQQGTHTAAKQNVSRQYVETSLQNRMNASQSRLRKERKPRPPVIPHRYNYQTSQRTR